MAAEAIRVELHGPSQLRDSLNEAGFMGGAVEFACMARQGHSPSMAGTVLLYGLVKLLLPGSSALPRTFVLAATADRVAAFRARGSVAGKDHYRVTVNDAPEATWPRPEVRMEPAAAGITANALLHVPSDGGAERIRCSVPNSQLEADLEAAIAALAAGR
jgi:hypothetical protein